MIGLGDEERGRQQCGGRSGAGAAEAGIIGGLSRVDLRLGRRASCASGSMLMAVQPSRFPYQLDVGRVRHVGDDAEDGTHGTLGLGFGQELVDGGLETAHHGLETVVLDALRGAALLGRRHRLDGHLVGHGVGAVRGAARREAARLLDSGLLGGVDGLCIGVIAGQVPDDAAAGAVHGADIELLSHLQVIENALEDFDALAGDAGRSLPQVALTSQIPS